MRVGVVGHVEWVEFIPVAGLPRAGEVVHAPSSFTRAAGGGGVAAAVLAELGAEVDFFCALGRDVEGDAAVEQLRARGVRAHVAWREEPTRRAVTMLEDDGERTIVTIGKRLEPSGDDDLPWSLLRGADGVFFTAGDGAALALAREAHVLVASPRARDALQAPGRVGGDPPAVDALVLSASDHDERESAQMVGERAGLLVVTEGARGGRWWGASEGRWEAEQPPGPAVDTYGCGDSFAAGFTFALAAGEPVAGAAALGARCGARCLARAGAP
jgi:ribokinase